MRARIDISEVEARTKIRAKYLRAIENEEWDLLPGPVYVKSFLRTYGEFLGLDSRALVDEYKRLYERPSDHDMRPISPGARDRERRRPRPRLGPVGAIVLVLAAVVVALFLVGGGLKSSNSSSTASTAATSARQRATATARAHGHTHRTTTPAPRPARPRPKTVSLKLVPTGTVYVCVVDEHGKKLIPGVIYAAGESIPAAKGRKLLLTLGNDAVQMTIDGKPVPVGVGSPIGYELTPGKLSPLPRALMPTCT